MIIIRQEEEKDFKTVENIAREAFWNLYFPGCHEHFVVHKLRNHADYLKELSFVIEIDGTIQGAIFYTKARIVTKDNHYDIISFGPVFIHPKLHRQGLGKKLIEYSILHAKEKGYRAIATLGYPYHYAPYGFLGGKTYNLSMPDGKFYKGLLILPLYENTLNGINGYVEFSDIFDVIQEDVDNFDSNFPSKEKSYQQSQNEYEKAYQELD